MLINIDLKYIKSIFIVYLEANLRIQLKMYMFNKTLKRLINLKKKKKETFDDLSHLTVIQILFKNSLYFPVILIL